MIHLNDRDDIEWETTDKIISWKKYNFLDDILNDDIFSRHTIHKKESNMDRWNVRVTFSSVHHFSKAFKSVAFEWLLGCWKEKRSFFELS